MNKKQECDNPHYDNGIVDYCPYYKTPIYCQVCDGYEKNN